MLTCLILNLLITQFHLSCGYDTETTIERSDFLEPKSLTSAAEIFQQHDKEYLMINMQLTYMQAEIICNYTYSGRLVIIEREPLAYFLAEALSETNIPLESLWIGGKIMKNIWYWYAGDKQVAPIRKEILKFLVDYSSSVNSTRRQCLAFSREYHDKPQFPSLLCNARRPMICERNAHKSINGSTHNGWIAIGNRAYKIFAGRISWYAASAECVHFDNNASLAVITNFREAQILGRYMLIGRPSLENAWIGARYYENNYVFDYEGIILSNKTDGNKFPPWPNGTIMKTSGCLLLDRHLCNETIFVETRCERVRSFICYKKISITLKTLFEDIFIDEFGYRLYLFELPWSNAKDTCDMYKPKYGGKLAEIHTKGIVQHLIYVMGQNKTAIEHIWLGATFDADLRMWVWDSSGTIVDLTLLSWLKNSTFFLPLEKYNTCLNMDRENHLVAIHYGTVCDYSQHFICSFPKDKLIELQDDEHTVNVHS